MGVSLDGLSELLPKELVSALEQTVDNGVNLNTSGLQANQDDTFGYDGTKSFQMIAGDLDVLASVGKDVSDGTAFIAGMMGNLLGDTLTKTGNYLAGVIGAYSVAGTVATHFGAAAVQAIIMDGAGKADAAVQAVIDGDSGAVNASAMFGVLCNNSTAGSGADFGLDLQRAAHDGFIACDAAFYKKAQIRLTEDVCIFTGTGSPSDGTTGANFSGGGSLYIKSGDNVGAVYINTGTKASPTWKLVTHA